jgi:hypothetical protein
LQIRPYRAPAGGRISRFAPTRILKAHPMFHSDDHLRLTGATGLRSLARGETAGVRSRPRTTDVDAFLERSGLSGFARKR